MSSYYTAAQLEAMRKEKIRKELADSIQRLSIQLQESTKTLYILTTPGMSKFRFSLLTIQPLEVERIYL